MKKSFVIIVFSLLMMILFAGIAQATSVTYAAELHTSKLNPVTNVLILEQDQSGTVHGTVYGANVPGNGQAVISHNPAFIPVRSLIIGITAGLDPSGADKTEIIMFLNKTFAASNKGVKWSIVFPGSSHSGTIDSLIAATAGNATQLTWFTNTFFTGIAAPAVFDTGAAFTVGEFSLLDPIGGSVAEPLAIPSLNTWTIIILALFLAGLAVFRIRCAHSDV
jgi:hypothetical protein